MSPPRETTVSETSWGFTAQRSDGHTGWGFTAQTSDSHEENMRPFASRMSMSHMVSTRTSIVRELETMAFGTRRKAIRRTMAPKFVAQWSARRISTMRLIESPFYNFAMVLIIMSNIIHLWVETDMRSDKGETPLFMGALAVSFLAAYSVDLTLRIYVHRWRFPRNGMNLFDFFVVVLDLVLAMMPGTQATSMSVLRGLRMLRIVRVIRSLVAFRELYLMMQGLVSALRAIVFGTMLIFACLILWSILAVELVQEENYRLWELGVYGDCPRCATAFDSVGSSMLTFISTIIAGDSWGKVSLPLIEHVPWTALIILPALLSLELGLLNVVAAVIVDRQAQARAEDDQFLHQMHEEDLKKSYGRLKQLFSSMDEDGSGALTLEELIHSFRNHSEFKELMELMDVQEDDLALVFQILDKDGSGEVSYNEFVEQLNTMRTTNSHTLLVFIKHLSARLSQQMEVQDLSIRRIREGLGIPPPEYGEEGEESLIAREMRHSLTPDMHADWPGEIDEDYREDQEMAAAYSNASSFARQSTSSKRITVCDIAEPCGRSRETQVARIEKEAEDEALAEKGTDAEDAEATDARPRKSAWRASAYGAPGGAPPAEAPDLSSRFLTLSEHIQGSLARLSEEALQRAGEKALWESTLALAALRAALPLLHDAAPPGDGFDVGSALPGLRGASLPRASCVQARDPGRASRRSLSATEAPEPGWAAMDWEPEPGPAGPKRLTVQIQRPDESATGRRTVAATGGGRGPRPSLARGWKAPPRRPRLQAGVGDLQTQTL